jgi:hypothetical protein
MIDFNRPDIVPKDRENKTTLVIDIRSSSRDFPKTEAKKIMKYESLALEINKIYGSLTT